MWAENQVAFAGWPLMEALLRTADRDLLKRINLATLDEKPAAEDLKQSEATLWTHVQQGRLVATGSIKKAAPKLLEPESLFDFQGVNWRESVLRRPGKREVTIERVRIYPILRSPDAISRLWGGGPCRCLQKICVGGS